MKALWVLGYPLRLSLLGLMWLVLALVDQKELRSSTFQGIAAGVAVRQMSRISYVELLMAEWGMENCCPRLCHALGRDRGKSGRRGDPRSVFLTKTGKRCLTRHSASPPAMIWLDTSRFRCRVIPLCRTLLPFSSQWFD